MPAIIADPDEGEPGFQTGYFVDRGPGYGTFHYRVLGRDLFGRTSAPSAPGSVVVSDDGVGGADPAAGSGLRGIEQRLATFDGTITVTSPICGPTVVTMELPCELSSVKTSPSSGTD